MSDKDLDAMRLTSLLVDIAIRETAEWCAECAEGEVSPVTARRIRAKFGLPPVVYETVGEGQARVRARPPSTYLGPAQRRPVAQVATEDKPGDDGTGPTGAA